MQQNLVTAELFQHQCGKTLEQSAAGSGDGTNGEVFQGTFCHIQRGDNIYSMEWKYRPTENVQETAIQTSAQLVNT